MNSSPPTLLDVLAPYESLLEVGIGHRTELAAALSEAGHTVTAIDISEQAVPDGVRFLLEDVTEPNPDRYAEVDVIYALRLPPDLQVPVAEVAETLSVPLYFTTLGTDPPVVPADPRTIQAGTVYVYSARDIPDASQ